MEPTRKLTPKQQRFADEYLIDLDATAAAKRAGYSERTAAQIGYQLLQKTSVQSVIAAGRVAQQERTNITADMVLAGMYKEANFTGEGSSHSARVAAWHHLGKHVGVFKDQKEVSGPGGGPIKTDSTVRHERLTQDDVREYLADLGVATHDDTDDDQSDDD